MLAEPHIAYSEQVQVNPLLYEFQMTCSMTPAYTGTLKYSQVLDWSFLDSVWAHLE